MSRYVSVNRLGLFRSLFLWLITRNNKQKEEFQQKLVQPHPSLSSWGFTFEGGGYRLGGAEGVRVGEGTLPGVADGLYSEVVTAGLSQPLDLVGVAGAAVDCHKPGQKK